jgi:hypothetical protein
MNIFTTLRRAVIPVIAVAALGAGFGTAAFAGVVLPLSSAKILALA